MSVVVERVAKALWEHPLGGMDKIDGPDHPLIQSLARTAADASGAVWHSMESAPTDGKHCILAVQEGCFVYAVQGAFDGRQWNAVHRNDVRPLCWIPNIRVPEIYLSVSFRVVQSGGAA